MNTFEQELRRIPWGELRAAHGRDANAVPDALRQLAEAVTEDALRRAYWRLDNEVVVQGALFQAAEFVVFPLLQLLHQGSPRRQRYVLDLLIEITGRAAGVHHEEVERGNDTLLARVRDKAREGVSRAYWLLNSEDHEVRSAAGEFLECVDPDRERLRFTLERMISSERVAEVGERLRAVLADLHRS
jgi:hypothetical protein